MSGTTAMLRPKDRAIRSIVSSDFFSGKSVATSAYPGKKMINGMPNIIRAGKSGTR